VIAEAALNSMLYYSWIFFNGTDPLINFVKVCYIFIYIIVGKKGFALLGKQEYK